MKHSSFLWALLAIAWAGCGDDANPSPEGSGGATSGSATTSTSGETTSAQTSAGSGGAGPSDLAIIAWNVESFPKSASAAEVVGEIITAELPAIAAFEEVDDVALLEAALDTATDYDVVTENAPPFALVLAVDHARAAILDAGSIFTEETYLFPRAPLVARVGLLDGTDFQLDVVVVHQKAQVDAESEQRRRDANERLVTWCKTRFESTGAPIVFVGDFNDQVTDPPADDVFLAFKSAESPAFWFPTAQSESDGDFTYVPFESFIDHQIATSNLQDTFPSATTTVLPLETQVDAYVSRVSDHRPVRVDFLR